MTTQTHKTDSDRSYSKWRIFGWSIFAVFVLSVASAGAGLWWYTAFLDDYNGRFYPGVYMEDVDLSGKEYMEVYDEFDARAGELKEDGVQVVVQGLGDDGEDMEFTMTSTIVPFSAAGNEREIFDVDYESSLQTAFQIGRDGDTFTNAKRQYSAWQFGRLNYVEYSFDAEYAEQVFKERLNEYESKPVDARVVIAADGSVESLPEQTGMGFDYDVLVTQLEERIRDLNTEPIIVERQTLYAEVTTEDIANQLAEIERILDKAPVRLAYEDREWELDRATLGGLLHVEPEIVTVDEDLLEEAVADIREEVDVEPIEGRWTLEKDEGGALQRIIAVEAETPQEGHTIDIEALTIDMNAWLQDNNEEALALQTVSTEPEFTEETVNELGIKDLLGTGHSNMAGSPYNRRQNIARGVELLNGLLIAPGEEFSVVETLKPFEIDNGYVPELVIKGNETIPEIGGGLCQIGTTTFRGAMEAGLDITYRQNHSYAVSYYYDDRNRLPGTDATLYDPAPDLRFINDTPGYVLLQTRIDGNDLWFDYWGISDGRVAEFTPPVASNWIDPPPMKIIETTDLAPGERRCTESAHKGVTTSFYYTIDFPEELDRDDHEEEFRSVYKPWQAVCLVGVEKLSEETNESAE